MKKSWIALLLGLILTFALLGCTPKNPVPPGPDDGEPEEPKPIVTGMYYEDWQDYRNAADVLMNQGLQTIAAEKASAAKSRTGTGTIAVTLADKSEPLDSTSLLFSYEAFENLNEQLETLSSSLELDYDAGKFGGEESAALYRLNEKLYIDAPDTRSYLDLTRIDADALSQLANEALGRFGGLLPTLPLQGLQAVGTDLTEDQLEQLLDFLEGLGLSNEQMTMLVTELSSLMMSGPDAYFRIERSVLNEDTTITAEIKYAEVLSTIEELIAFGDEFVPTFEESRYPDLAQQWESLVLSLRSLLPKAATVRITESYSGNLLTGSTLTANLTLNLAKSITLDSLSAMSFDEFLAAQTAAYANKDYNTCTLAIEVSEELSSGDGRQVVIAEIETYQDATQQTIERFDSLIYALLLQDLTRAGAAIGQAVQAGVTVPAAAEGETEVALTSLSSLEQLSARQLAEVCGLSGRGYELTCQGGILTAANSRKGLDGELRTYTLSLDLASGEVVTPQEGARGA